MTDTEPHRPEYIYCGWPETCCGHYEVVAIVCRVCRKRWPCETKLSHHTAVEGARIKRWVDSRIGRPPRSVANVSLESSHG